MDKKSVAKNYRFLIILLCCMVAGALVGWFFPAFSHGIAFLGKVFINLMDATLHPDAGYHPEYHKLYADLQVDLTGSEGWGYTNLPGAEIGEFTGDCGFQDSASVVTGALGEGRFVLFFPEELHKPGLVQHGCVSVRKAVVKIRMEE